MAAAVIGGYTAVCTSFTGLVEEAAGLDALPGFHLSGTSYVAISLAIGPLCCAAGHAAASVVLPRRTEDPARWGSPASAEMLLDNAVVIVAAIVAVLVALRPEPERAPLLLGVASSLFGILSVPPRRSLAPRPDLSSSSSDSRVINRV